MPCKAATLSILILQMTSLQPHVQEVAELGFKRRPAGLQCLWAYH